MLAVQTDIHVANDDREIGANVSIGPEAADFGSAPFNSIYGAPIVVTQTTNYSNWGLGNNAGIQFETSAASNAIFNANQFDNPGQIDTNATITGDSHADTITADITSANYYGGWGFDGSHFQLQNWSSADKFVINLDAAPPGAYPELIGTSGNDVFNVGALFDANTFVEGGAGANTLKFAGNYASASLGQVNDIQAIDLAGGYSYDLSSGHDLVSAGTVTVNASSMGTGDTLEFDASGDSAGRYVFDCGAWSNSILLNNLADKVVCGTGVNYIYDYDGVMSAGTQIIGAGFTSLELFGDYSAGYTFGPNAFTNIAQLNLDGGNSYKLTTNDANVAAGTTLLVNASGLGTGDSLYFNGTHESNGHFTIDGGAGLNTLFGGALGDTFEFDGTGTFTAADRINGEGGNNTLALNGDYSAGLKFAAATIVNIQNIQLSAGDSYNLTLANANVAAGQTLIVSGTALTSTDTLVFNGSHVTNGNLAIYAGAGNDTLTGGGGNDLFVGGGGADTMHAGTGQDTFAYSAVADSTSTGHDTIVGFNALTDTFELEGPALPEAIDPAVTTGKLQTSAFDADLAQYVGANQLHAGDAVLFTPSTGNLSGHTFLVIDENGVAGYQAGQDLVIELTSATNLSHFGLANFEV